MIDIIGNIIISNEIRQKYFNATLHSLCNINDCINRVDITIDSPKPHGIKMMEALNNAKSSYFLNFEEDHYCVCNSPVLFKSIINNCHKYNVDVVKASFFDIENNCAKHVTDVIFENNLVKIFKMTYDNFKLFQKPYSRFYLGTNSIFKTEYAKKIFLQPGIKPHDFELRQYIFDYEYVCAVPKIEILRAIDDDHGEENTCMLKNPTPQFLNLMK